MSNLCQHHRHQLSRSAPEQLKQLWQQLISSGQQARQQVQIEHAMRMFASAAEVAQLSTHNPLTAVYADDFLQMEFIAVQQLSECLVNEGHIGKAISFLSQTHNKLLKICSSRQSSRLAMMGALGILDNSLLSLTSTLGKLERIDEIYEVIERTEEVAALTEQKLWH